MENLFEPYFRKRRMGMIGRHIKRGSVVCDIGCGFDGTVLRELRGKIKKGIGIDKKVSSEKFENIELRKALISGKLPKIQKADYVFMLAVIEHLDKPEEVLQECRKVLKDGGKIMLTTPSPKSRFILEFLSMLRLVSPDEIRDHKNYFSPQDLRRLLADCGFKDVHTELFEAGLNTFAIATK